MENRITQKKIIVECDNIVVLEVINHRKATDKKLQRFLRELAYISSHFSEKHDRFCPRVTILNFFKTESKEDKICQK